MVDKAVNDDFNKEEMLVKEYSRLVKICARPYFLAGGDNEDLYQEGMLGLLSAIRTFDPDRGAKFSTYAEVCVKRRIHTAIKSASGNKHTPLNTYISLESLHNGEESSTQSLSNLRAPEEIILALERAEEVKMLLTGALSRFESAVLELYLEGMSYKDMAVSMGKSEKSIDNAVQRIRRKLSQILK